MYLSSFMQKDFLQDDYITDVSNRITDELWWKLLQQDVVFKYMALKFQ